MTFLKETNGDEPRRRSCDSAKALGRTSYIDSLLVTYPKNPWGYIDPQNQTTIPAAPCLGVGAQSGVPLSRHHIPCPWMALKTPCRPPIARIRKGIGHQAPPGTTRCQGLVRSFLYRADPARRRATGVEREGRVHHLWTILFGCPVVDLFRDLH